MIAEADLWDVDNMIVAEGPVVFCFNIGCIPKPIRISLNASAIQINHSHGSTACKLAAYITEDVTMGEARSASPKFVPLVKPMPSMKTVFPIPTCCNVS